MVSKPLVKQRVYGQQQLMCDPRSCSASAVLGKTKVLVSEHSAWADAGGSTTPPAAPFGQQWMTNT